MPTTRRNFFRNLAAGAAVAAGLPVTVDLALSELVPGSRAAEQPGLMILSRNENAYGPSEKVTGCMQQALQFANRYPDPSVDMLKDRIAASHAVHSNRVVLGCGSGEILNTSAAAFLAPGKKLITALPTFEAIGRCAKVLGAEVLEVPLNKDYAHDLPAMLARADASTGLVYICNPNNPTGSLTPRKDLESFVRQLPPNTTVLLDEAYHHFVGAHPDYVSFLDQPMDDDRLIVARTFSKVFGLAGMRIGYAVGSPGRIQALSSRRLAEGLNAVGARAALIAFDDTDYVKFSASRNADDRRGFFEQAKTRNIEVIPSSTNFAMLQTHRKATDVIEHFKKNNIAIARLFPSMSTFVRVSFGKPDEMKEFWRVWDLLPTAGA